MLHHTLLRVDVAERSMLRRGYRLLYYTLRGVNTHRINVDSAALTLNTLFALVPLLTLVLLILGKLGVFERYVAVIYAGAPQDWHFVLDRLVATATAAAENIAPGFVAVVGVAALLIAIFNLFRTAEVSFNRVWGVTKRRGFLLRYTAYFIVAVFVPVLLLTAMVITSDILSMAGLETEISAVVTYLVSLMLVSVACTLLYKYLPFTPVEWRVALVAGVAAGVAFSLWQWGYVYFQSLMTSYNIIYGGLAFIPLLILWVQVSWNIILVGCELGNVLQHRHRFERIDRRRLHSSVEVAEAEQRVRVVVIGSGNVAEALVRTLSGVAAVDVVQLFARNRERGMAVAALASCAWGSDEERLADADIYIIAVSDRVVAEVASTLRFPDAAIVVHTAGSVPMSAIPARGGRRGILYPLQSFTKGRAIRLDNVPLFIEADSEDTREHLMRFARSISSRVEYADSALRRQIHLAGVFVNNFTNHMYHIGAEVMEDAGLSYDVLKPLIEETAAKAIATESPTRVQTGPAVRGDSVVTSSHMAMLEDDARKQLIYKYITESIWETSKRM